MKHPIANEECKYEVTQKQLEFRGEWKTEFTKTKKLQSSALIL